MYVKEPFKEYLGAKHCVICKVYIPPTNMTAYSYSRKTHCDIVCSEIDRLLKRLKKLIAQKHLEANFTPDIVK